MISKVIKKHRLSKVKILPANFSVVVPSEIGRRGVIDILKSITDLPVHYYMEKESIQNLIRGDIPYIQENVSENGSIPGKDYSFMFHMHKFNGYRTGWDRTNPNYELSNPIITWDEFINGSYVG